MTTTAFAAKASFFVIMCRKHIVTVFDIKIFGCQDEMEI